MSTRTMLLATFAAFGLLGSAARADVTIGVALPRTGALASIGDQVLNGVRAAAQDINDHGGIYGQMLVLDVQDDACDPRQAVSVANRFAQGGIKLIVGHVCSGASIAASDVYAEDGDLMISPASNSAKLTERGLSGIFRVCGRDDQQGKVAATALAARFRDKKIAILHDNAPFGRGMADATKAALAAEGIDPVMFAGITPGEHDYTAVITRLKAAGIDVVYYGGYHAETGTLVRQGADQGFRGQWMGTSGISTKEFANIAGPASDGVLMTFNPDPRHAPGAAGVVAGFRAKKIEPEGFTLYAYTALQVLAAAANAARSIDPAVVGAALKAGRFDTVLGPVGFDAAGDITAAGYVLYVWKAGDFSAVD